MRQNCRPGFTDRKGGDLRDKGRGSGILCADQKGDGANR